jgi:hypothetical protein
MEGIVGSLRLGWEALLLKEDAYEQMRAAANPVVKGLILIVVVGVIIALLGFVGDVLEWATTPDLAQIKDTVFAYMMRMPWWADATAGAPQFEAIFRQWYDFGWDIALNLASPNVGWAAAGLILTPLGLIVRWFLYGLLAYLFARMLGGTGDLTETLGVLALAVAPQALNVLALFPYVEPGALVAIWGLLCAYLGLKVAHKLSWYRSVWATLLPFLLVIGVAILGSCVGSAIFAAAVKGGG